MAKTTGLKNNERLVSINYDDMTTLLAREGYIEKTLNNYLDQQGNKQVISKKCTSMNQDKYYINFVLSPNNKSK